MRCGAGMWMPGDVINGAYRLGLVARRFGNVAVHFAEPVTGGPGLLIHVLVPTVDERGTGFARFEALGQALGRFSHSGLLDVLDWGFAHRRAYFVTEGFDGIKGAGQTENLPPIERLHVLASVVSAIEAIHQKGWTHGQLSISSIASFGRGPSVKIVDLSAVLLQQVFGMTIKPATAAADQSALVSLSGALGHNASRPAPKVHPGPKPITSLAPVRPTTPEPVARAVVASRPAPPRARPRLESSSAGMAISLDDFGTSHLGFGDRDWAEVLRPNFAQRITELIVARNGLKPGRRPEVKADATSTLHLTLTCTVALVTLLVVLNA